MWRCVYDDAKEGESLGGSVACAAASGGVGQAAGGSGSVIVVLVDAGVEVGR